MENLAVTCFYRVANSLISVTEQNVLNLRNYQNEWFNVTVFNIEYSLITEYVTHLGSW